MTYLYLTLIIFALLILSYTIINLSIHKTNVFFNDVPHIDDVENEKLGNHAEKLSEYHKVTKKSSSRRVLMKRLDKSYAAILRGYEYIDRDVRNKKEIVPAAEWLLDNLYLIEKEYKDIKHNMPESYYKSLPRIDKGSLRGLPRIYHIGAEIIAHTDGKIDENTIISFIEAYEKHTVLTIAELWALPIMLRIALIQNISSVTEKIVFAQREKRKADDLADKIINLSDKELDEQNIEKMFRGKNIFSTHFMERFLKVLMDNGVENKKIYDYIDKIMNIEEIDSNKMIILEHQKQARLQLSMRNCISAIREVEALNWRESFEKLSLVERVLKEDPANVYNNMDFSSRDYYRHQVEKLSKYMRVPESYVAKAAIKCAKEQNSSDILKNHVGYYLLDDGIKILKTKIKFTEHGIGGAFNFIKRYRVASYIYTNVIGTLLLDFVILWIIYITDYYVMPWKYVLGGLIILIPCSEIVNSILNWSINHLIKPTFVPKMELSAGIPGDAKTIVVIPSILNNENRVDELINNMEVYYLANREKNIYFALLGDFKDSVNEKEESDNSINRAALKHIKALNRKYSTNGKEIFFFFNRYRQFNESENLWMGWERKRGKLMEFNSLLRGDKNTSYNVMSGNLEQLYDVKYVITLDADTRLPINAAKKLIGAMTHILNKAVIKEDKVVRGYGIMQPRVSISTVSANKTMFSSIFSGETGIDTYSTAVSDVYQDLFAEGIFTGKGIYDIDVFQTMLKAQFPENTVLSHDLLEGSYARTALVTDIELMDGYPAYYSSSSKRLHRWVRGDWQIASWIFKKSPINALSRWKIIDNLRRSLVSTSIIILTICSFTVLPYNPDRWLSIAFLALICPWLFDVSEVVASPMRGLSLSGKINNSKTVIEQVFLIFAFLPYKAFLMLDAIVRTLYRLLISRRNLLEWQTADDAEKTSGKSLNYYIKMMWSSSVIAVAIGGFAFAREAIMGIIMFPSCVVWFISPAIAYYISRERKLNNEKINIHDTKLLARLSRKTWAYFEDFVNEESNFLAPDNYQEEYDKGVAFRTSPTNMGMGLTSNIVAYDLGFIGIGELVERLNKVLFQMETLPMYRGHFYNWYDTKTKQPLNPRYISTVDSGNLVGYLWLIISALNDYKNMPLINSKYKNGLKETIEIANEEANKNIDLKAYYDDILDEFDKNNFDLVGCRKIILGVINKAKSIEEKYTSDKIYWNLKVKNVCNKFIGEIEKFVPELNFILNNKDEEEYIYYLNKICMSTKIKDIDYEIEKVKMHVSKQIKNNPNKMDTLLRLMDLLDMQKKEIEGLINDINNLIDRFKNLANSTDFGMLFDKKRNLFAIGYDIDSDSLGKSYYDLLASEARQASFIAISKGDIPESHWFKLGRAMTSVAGRKGLVSWSGTMFEYFMPLIIMKNYPDTLLNETYKTVVESQKKYCKSRGIPCWGISESAFYKVDVDKNFQYKAFGVPGIGLKRGLANELVISPYSSVMALQLDLIGAIQNIKKLIAEGMEGRYGLYEAIDYTKDRMEKGKEKSIVRCFMVHHEGMSLMALDNVLNNNILQERFHSLPRVKAAELLLQERIPKRVVYDREQAFEVAEFKDERQNIIARTFKTAKTEIPEVQLLSNGNYSVMISNSGSGYSRKGDIDLYRWREDLTKDDNGMFFYIKDISTGKLWSATYEPCKSEGDSYEVMFTFDKAEFKRRDGGLVTNTSITVSNEEDAEVRKISITNHGNTSKVIEITSYSEVTIAPHNADLVHPAFSNLFVSTEFVEEPQCILATRRPRSDKEDRHWIMQSMVVEGETLSRVEYETSRVNFIGRGKNRYNPEGINNPLKNTVGDVLDPIISIRKKVRIAPGKTCSIYYINAISKSKEELIGIANKYSRYHSIKRAFELALTHSQVELKYMGIKSPQANIFQAMASRILFISDNLKNREKYVKNIKKSQPDLWGYGISGDLPIVLLIVREENDIGLARQMLTAQEYLISKGLKMDLVIINLQQSSYIQVLQDSLRDTIASSHIRDRQNKSGGVFLYSRAEMPKDYIEFLIGIARFVVAPENGLLVSQVKVEARKTNQIPDLKTEKIEYEVKPYKFDVGNLRFFNEYGGFNDNDNYVIILNDNKNTPAPWINVISNDKFGFHVSESGASYTWSSNSRENKLTTWYNDPVSDPLGEALFIRDEVTGKFWSISPKPVRDNNDYIIEHGFGYSTFKHYSEGIIGTMSMFVPMTESLKIITVKLKNNTNILRKLSLTYFAELTLGVVPEHTASFVSTYVEENDKFIYAQNPYSTNFGNAFAYLKIAGGENESFTGSRKEFIGRGGKIENPQFMVKERLSNDVGSGEDPCISENVKVELKPNEEKELIIMFGQDMSIEVIKEITEKYSSFETANKELQNTIEYWNSLLHTITVKTPDETMNLIMNGWLMYQTIACRVWARTAFYQSGGAYGFRDQLQDVMSLSYIKPQVTRNQILINASRQFIQGDVQHWWHPVVNSGIRTRFSDDLLWLPFVTIDYIKNTGDYSVLDEKVNYIEDDPLREGEDERYNVARLSEKSETIYEHCLRAIEKGLKFGIHNIPLMGSGDWNDGMNTVGNKGKGESVWLGWFMYSILKDFKGICERKGDEYRVQRYGELSEFVRENIEKNAWDGEWYRRAYFDDGTPLGSSENDECRIDSLAQSWSIISGAAQPARAEKAMSSLKKYLVKEDKGVILLLTPPFNESKLEPGYIKGYVPGVRENGGQYTHAATWVIYAMTKLGHGKEAVKMFNMINPINHAKSYYDCQTYKVEPYVMAADVYAKQPYVGRGGWTWYTGTAGWMYRIGIDGILGLKLVEGRGFAIKPCIPEDWSGYSIKYRHENATYNIEVYRGGNKEITLDGSKIDGEVIPFSDYGEHKVEVII
ncbi:GH36-type glycosyl hydrolase domain-containing protein [Clostridium hydrogenum]|uniref:GH36-type glycosyl hydrolase domain-containing protein n=1 Tax=Clostridium hydrogenum TaxID=2855764 RepID=UPI001F319203|nr:glucoamylase family protein [Clostridium hydrogenum]